MFNDSDKDLPGYKKSYNGVMMHKFSLSPDNFPHPILNVEEESKHDYNQSCCICLTDFEDKDKLRDLKCFHKFHSECLSEYLKQPKSIKCPLCKKD